MRYLTALLCGLAAPLCAQEARADAYVEANLLSIFYHELGHAIIDLMALPVLGQEEDAADTASILLIDALYDEDAAQAIARDAAFGFLDEADAAGGAEPAWWDEHGPDLQRYYNLVCLFYGADPDAREDLADDLNLPAERADSCEEEFEQANDSWGPVLDDLAADGAGASIVFESENTGPIAQLIADEVAALNSEWTLPDRLTVVVEPCDEANAFYIPDDRQITMCTELLPHLQDFADAAD